MTTMKQEKRQAGWRISTAPRKIFLAGLGAVLVAREVGEEGFERLVEKGRRVEAMSQVREPLPFGDGEEVREAETVYGHAPYPSTVHMPELIDVMTPAAVPTPAVVLQARRNAAARAALIEEIGVLTSGDIADLNDSLAGNRAALASRWKREGRIFSVRHHGQDYFPAFQLDAEHRPREVVGRILEAMGGAEGWETALWFVAANGYLDGRRPIDLLESDPDEVVRAAEEEAAEIFF